MLPGGLAYPGIVAALPGEAPAESFAAFLAGKNEGVFFVQLTVKPIIEEEEGDILAMPVVAATPIAWLPPTGLSVGLPGQILLSSKLWIGRPDDPAARNRPAAPRLAAPRIQRRIPVTPSEAGRAQTTVATLVLANKDRRFDPLIRGFRVREGEVVLRYGRRRGFFELDSRIIARAVAKSVDAQSDEFRLELDEVRDMLSGLVETGRFDGRGGLGGDFDIAGQIVPTTIGDVFNMTPVRISRLKPIYQVDAGPIFGVPGVRERMLPFTPMGVDVATFEELFNLEIPPGFFATCLAHGLFALGDEPVGVVTCDVYGATFGGEEVTQAGPAMLALAIKRLGVSADRLNTPAFFAPEFTRAIGWTSDQRSVTGLQFFQEILAGDNSHVSGDAEGRLSVAAVRAPENLQPSRTIRVSGEKIRPQFFENTVRVKQRVLYRKNFTRLAPSDISEFADAGLAQRAQQDGEIAEYAAGPAASFGVADDGVVQTTYWRDYAAAIESARERAVIESRDRNLIQIVDLPRDYVDTQLGEVVRIEIVGEKRYGMDGLNFIVSDYALDGKSETVTLEVFG